MKLKFKPWQCLCFIALLLAKNPLLAQSYIADTLIIPNELIKVPDDINYLFTVNDCRQEGPHFISIFEKKKWLFFPVDQVVNTSKTLSETLEQGAKISETKSVQLSIHEFYIQQNETMNKRLFKLNTSIELSEIQAQDTTLLGVFYYEELSKQKKKDSLLNGYATAINNINQQLFSDISTVLSGQDTIDQKISYNFRRGYQVAPKNFYVTSDVYAGSNFWGFDVEFSFSAPEPSQKFMRKSGMLRYMDFENRQSVAIARNVNYFNYRLNNRFLLQNKHAFLLGFNKWNDIDEAKRTLEEMFLFQLSATQKICYNPIDKRSLVFGLGLMEDFSYIIYNKPMINLAVVATLGFKF